MVSINHHHHMIIFRCVLLVDESVKNTYILKTLLDTLNNNKPLLFFLFFDKAIKNCF